MSEIIPEAGRERNNLIAKLKDIKPVYACYADNISGDENCVLDDNKPFDCGICEREKITDKFKCRKWEMRPDIEWIPAWSTSHNDDWELFQKMPFDIQDFAIDEWRVLKYDIDKFAPIISEVWIKWKQK